MANFPRVTLLALASAAALVLSGCLAPTPEPAPSPVASSSPVFASEEEALAAATEAYAAYLDVSDQIAAEGWRDTSILETVAVGKALEEDLLIAADFHELGYAQVGRTGFNTMSVQQLDETGPRAVIVQAYACLDVSGIDVRDAEGVSIVPEDRPKEYPLELTFSPRSAGTSDLVLARSESWSGENFC